jgi:hypothetical protein
MADHAVLHEDGSYTYGGDHGEWEHDGNFCVDGLFYPDRTPSTGAKIMKYIYRPVRVSHTGENRFEIFNTTAFTEGSQFSLTFVWNDGTEHCFSPDVPPMTRKTAELPLGKPVNGTQTAVVITRDKYGQVLSEEQLILSLAVPSAPVLCAPDAGCSVEDGRLIIRTEGKTAVATAEEGTLMYRAGTDNDTNPFFSRTMAPYLAQREELLSCEKTANGWHTVTRISNKKATFTVTDTYEGVDGGLLVTSHLHCERGGGFLPRFGKAFRLDSAFDTVSYTGRTGESYIDMKEQFPLGHVTCRVADMTEPNLKPQESGNRCDCTEASVSDGTVAVHFIAVDTPFELGIKPYTDRALAGMRHRKDEQRTGTYVTIQAFQQGIGTGACGPAIAKEHLFSARKDYELKFIIRVERI